MRNLIVGLLLLLIAPAVAAPAPITVASVAELRAGNFGSYAAVQLIGWKAGTAMGGGLLTKGATGCIDNSGTVFKDAANNCFYRNYIGQDVSFGQFGAQGDGQRRYDCTVTSGSHNVHCSGYTFVAADVAKVIGIQWAGSVASGFVTKTFISTIASISSGNAVMTGTVTTTPSGPAGDGPGAVFFGTNDTIAVQAALAATIGVSTCIATTPGQNYIVTSALVWGGTANIPHCFKGNNAGILNLQSSNVNDANTISGVFVGSNGMIPGQSYQPVFMSDFYFDCLDTGRDCISLGNNSSASFENVTVNNSYRNCFAVAPTTAWVDNLRAQTLLLAHCGLHGLYAYLNQANNPYFNIAHFTNVEVNSYGYNSAGILAAAGGPSAPWVSWSGGDKAAYNSQLGSCFYFINMGTSGPMSWHTFDNIACQTGSTTDTGGGGAYFWGSNINPAMIYMADGRQAHLIEGAGNASASLGTRALEFRVSDFENNGATPSWVSGKCVQAETALFAAAIQYFYAVLNGPEACSPELSWGVINGAHIGPTYTPGAGAFKQQFGGEIVLGDTGMATTATLGFPWMPSVAGKPTGVPAANAGGAMTGFVPFIYDSTNHQICAYDFGTSSWQPAGCH